MKKIMEINSEVNYMDSIFKFEDEEKKRHAAAAAAAAEKTKY